MFSRIHEKLGTAGFIIAIVALVAALSGGAYAAKSGLSGKEKKEVQKIAKKEATKFAGKPGANGAAGPAGPVGPAGANGKDGSNGTNGTPGAAGKSVVSSVFTVEDEENGNPAGEPCELNGGIQMEVEGSGVKSFVCNGEEGEPGSPWTVGGLPTGATERGTWSATVDSSGTGRGSISFNVPLAAEVPSTKVHLISLKKVAIEGSEPPPAGCENINGALSNLPITPDRGNLCIWVNDVEGTVPFAGVQISNPLFPAGSHGIAGPEGALMEVSGTAGQFSFGTWAVTGE